MSELRLAFLATIGDLLRRLAIIFQVDGEALVRSGARVLTIWVLVAGWWLALGHLIWAILFAITIVGLPFAWAHFKLAGIALWPIGKMIVPTDALPHRLAGGRQSSL